MHMKEQLLYSSGSTHKSQLLQLWVGKPKARKYKAGQKSSHCYCELWDTQPQGWLSFPQTYQCWSLQEGQQCGSLPLLQL